jgi:thymidylate synthase (FAD)
MNARSLLNFFELRCCASAQWEIRALANAMLALVKPVAPTIFENAGPPCVSRRVCTEGKRSCGRWKTISGAILRE